MAEQKLRSAEGTKRSFKMEVRQWFCMVLNDMVDMVDMVDIITIINTC